VIGTASFPSAHYTRHYDAELVAPVLERFARARIGLLGTYQLSYAMGAFLHGRFPRAHFAEASELIDAIKAIKSPEEQDLIRATAAMQDEVMRVALAAVEPGRKESEVTAVARAAAFERGSEAGIVLCGAGPIGEPAVIAPRHLQNRTIKAGDVLALLVEVDGPGGLYTELGRTCTVGPAPEKIKEELAVLLAAQRYSLEQMRPGARCSDVFDAYNEFLREQKRPEERRIHSHGQGYDLVERPLIRADETMSIQAGMNFACHPAYVTEGFFAWICDNWLIGADGPGERLHTFPQTITEV
jgi:Xaa-Pro aminopeptidase